ncbi:hypothetical protein B6A42_27035 (plasmid) [Vibrio coralliilyticus]|nr:hypothetical protein B6A42_27035 [Vibrio coralliilyticus]
MNMGLIMTTTNHTGDQFPCSWNCLPASRTPDWKEYDAIEMMPCTDDSADLDETCLTSHLLSEVDEDRLHVDGEKIVCWTVFGHLRTGGIEDLHDCETEEQAKALEAWCDVKISENIDR